jgi:cytochrome c553
VRGTDLAARLGVSRQVIVQDVALLRASGEPIVATPGNRAIALENCVACHRPVVEAMLLRPGVYGPEDLNCTACHGNVGHRGLK